MTKSLIPEIFNGVKYLDPKYDPAFKAFFDSEDALKSFLNSVLHLEGEKQIKRLTYQIERSMRIRVPEPLTYRFDISAVTEAGEFIDIEMQRAEHSFFLNRMVIYNAMQTLKSKKEFDKKLKKMPQKEQEKYYYKVPPAISIWICNFKVFENPEHMDEINLHSKNTLKSGIFTPITDVNKYIIVELTKFNKKNSELTSTEDFWFYCLKNLGGNTELPINANEVFKEALERIEVCEDNVELLKDQEQAMLTQGEILCRIADAEDAGEARGLAKGAITKAREMAKAMLLDGLSIAKVSAYSGLSESEIKSL